MYHLTSCDSLCSTAPPYLFLYRLASENGLRCLAEHRSTDVLAGMLDRAAEAAAVWGEAVPAASQQRAVELCRRRLSIAGLAKTEAVA